MPECGGAREGPRVAAPQNSMCPPKKFVIFLRRGWSLLIAVMFVPIMFERFITKKLLGMNCERRDILIQTLRCHGHTQDLSRRPGWFQEIFEIIFIVFTPWGFKYHNRHPGTDSF